MKSFLWIPVAIVVWLLLIWANPHDDTDPPGERSGLGLYTDHKTGCQYLKAGSLFGGNLTPRMDSTGRQICSGNGEE